MRQLRQRIPFLATRARVRVGLSRVLAGDVGAFVEKPGSTNTANAYAYNLT
jgi:hypothetical protein